MWAKKYHHENKKFIAFCIIPAYLHFWFTQSKESFKVSELRNGKRNWIGSKRGWSTQLHGIRIKVLSVNKSTQQIMQNPEKILVWGMIMRIKARVWGSINSWMCTYDRTAAKERCLLCKWCEEGTWNTSEENRCCQDGKCATRACGAECEESE